MKKFLATAANQCAAYLKSGDFAPFIELVIVYTEPHYAGVDVHGQLTRQEVMGECRVAISPESARQFSEWLIQYADDADAALQCAKDNIESHVLSVLPNPTKKKESECDGGAKK